jgi:hypothetical protein
MTLGFFSHYFSQKQKLGSNSLFPGGPHHRKENKVKKKKKNTAKPSHPFSSISSPLSSSLSLSFTASLATTFPVSFHGLLSFLFFSLSLPSTLFPGSIHSRKHQRCHHPSFSPGFLLVRSPPLHGFSLTNELCHRNAWKQQQPTATSSSNESLPRRLHFFFFFDLSLDSGWLHRRQNQ